MMTTVSIAERSGRGAVFFGVGVWAEAVVKPAVATRIGTLRRNADIRSFYDGCRARPAEYPRDRRLPRGRDADGPGRSAAGFPIERDAPHARGGGATGASAGGHRPADVRRSILVRIGPAVVCLLPQSAACVRPAQRAGDAGGRHDAGSRRPASGAVTALPADASAIHRALLRVRR